MNDKNKVNSNILYSGSQISKNLPLKKRRNYLIDSSTTVEEKHDNYSKMMKVSEKLDEYYRVDIPGASLVPTPLLSPYVDLLHQHLVLLCGNVINTEHLNSFHPINMDSLRKQKLLIETYVDNYRILSQQNCVPPLVNDPHSLPDNIIDEHFRKSLGDNYEKLSGPCVTVDDSSSKSSSIEQNPEDLIEEHFARSLGKLWPLKDASSLNNETLSMNYKTTESVVDEHFAKALGFTTWGELKEKY